MQLYSPIEPVLSPQVLTILHSLTFLCSSDNMEDDEAVKHLFQKNRCDGYESSGQETPQLESFPTHGQEDPQIHGKSLFTSYVSQLS